MKPAPGKRGAAMPEKAAKKVVRRNERRDRTRKLHDEAKEYGLGAAQVEHFLAMDDHDLRNVKTQSAHELALLGGYQDSDAKRDKVKEHQNRINYVTEVLRRRGR